MDVYESLPAFFRALEGWQCEVDSGTWLSLSNARSDLSQKLYEQTEAYMEGMGKGPVEYAPVNLFLECMNLLREEDVTYDRRIDAKGFLTIVHRGIRNEETKNAMRRSLNRILTTPAEQLSKKDLSTAVRLAKSCIRLWDNAPDLVKVQRQVFQDAFDFLKGKDRNMEEEGVFRQVCTHQYEIRVPLGIAYLTLEAVSQYHALHPVDSKLASRFLPAQIADRQDLYEMVLERVTVVRPKSRACKERPLPKEVHTSLPEESFADTVYGLIVKQSREQEYPEEIVAGALELALSLDESASDEQRQELKEQFARFEASKPLNRVLLQSMPGWQQFRVFSHNLVEEVRQGRTPDVAGVYHQACGAYSA